MRFRFYRVQDNDGRGPFRRGFSGAWTDDDGPDQMLTIFDEFGFEWANEIRDGEYCGCAVRLVADINRWFTPLEQERLAAFGYFVVCINAERIIRESKNQIIFARNKPLNHKIVVIPWPALSVAA